VRWTAPYGRDGRFKSLHEVTRHVIVNEFGGDEPSRAMLDALVAFQAALRFPPGAPLEPMGRLGVASSTPERRGESLFVRDCARCHVPSSGFTDGRAHDVGTGGTFDTPTLRGLGLSAPYLHDGRAPDLEAVIAHFEKTLSLEYDGQERRDLSAYLSAVGRTQAPVPRTLDSDVADVRAFIALLDYALNDEDDALAGLIAAMIRVEIGRIAERFPDAAPRDISAHDRLAGWSGLLSRIAADAGGGRFPEALRRRDDLLDRIGADLPNLRRLAPTSLYDRATLARALDR
jgi:mono/diheme cytochrome c family protein